MPKEVVLVTTKPDENTAEYAIRDTDTKKWLMHSALITVPFDKLTATEKSKIVAARDIMLRVATEDATARGFV